MSRWRRAWRWLGDAFEDSLRGQREPHYWAADPETLPRPEKPRHRRETPHDDQADTEAQ